MISKLESYVGKKVWVARSPYSDPIQVEVMHLGDKDSNRVLVSPTPGTGLYIDVQNCFRSYKQALKWKESLHCSLVNQFGW